MNVNIRQETPNDYNATEQVVEQAFANAELSDKNEHLLVSRIRNSEGFLPELSIVATEPETNKLVGHILLSKIQIRKNDGKTVESLALAPVSVLPEKQNKGIGGLLISEALRKAKELGYLSVIVLGHPEYYPKFGFKSASLWGIKAPFEVPEFEEVFEELQLKQWRQAKRMK